MVKLTNKTQNFTQNIFVKSGAGFTLVELLVVIAIIGILSSIAVINLNSAKQRARNTAVLNQIESLSPVIYVCLDNQSDLICTDIDGGNPEVDRCKDVYGLFGSAERPPNNGQGDIGPIEICAGAKTYWPNVEQYGWEYTDPFDYSTTSHSWTISTTYTPDNLSIVCTQTGCTTQGF